MMKKILLVMISVFLLTLSAGAVDLYVDNVKIETDTPPMIVSNRTLVPVRAIFEALGADMTWDGETRTATGKNTDKTVVIQIGSATAYVNGEATTLDVPAQIINNRTMVPARFVSEALGANVYWDGATQTVRIANTVYDVLRVVDGDTIVVDFNGTKEKVRMIGIDTPESVHPDQDKNTEAGKAAYEYTRDRLEGQQVELEFDMQERDIYGRLLAYVYLNGVMFNKTLLEDEIAVISTYPPNVKYVNDFLEISSRHNGGNTQSGTNSKPGDNTNPGNGDTFHTYDNPDQQNTEDKWVLNLNSHKIHFPTCREVVKIAPHNYATSNLSEEELISQGYATCGVCH